MRRTSKPWHLGFLKPSAWLCVALVPFATSSATGQPAQPAGTLFPAPGAKDVCPDTPLRIRFPDTPLAGVGKIEVRDSADDSVVATIDVASPTRTRTIGGLPNFRDHPVIIGGGEAAIFLPGNALGYNKTYSVRVDAGAFKDATGAPHAGVGDAGSWRFSTRPAPPAAGSRRITVAADNSGDFATVQGALDFIPDGNTVPTTIFIRSGTYREIVCFTNKHAVTLLGEDRKKTVIAYANNDRFNNNAGGNPFGPGAGPPGRPTRGVGAPCTAAACCSPTGSTTWSSPTSRSTIRPRKGARRPRPSSSTGRPAPAPSSPASTSSASRTPSRSTARRT